ncbi:MAG TPA: hypothetical protein VHL99_08765 [Candidatus Binatia bacterium]|nr:hypothetical protein [Candidatus Binatia bacterium]
MQLREANDSYLGRNITAKNVSFKSRAAGFFLATTAKIFYVAVPMMLENEPHLLNRSSRS